MLISNLRPDGSISLTRQSAAPPLSASIALWSIFFLLSGGVVLGQAFTVCQAYACSGELHTIDLATGATQPVGVTGSAIKALAFDFGGGLWGVGGDTPTSDLLVRIDPDTGAPGIVGPLGVVTLRADLAFSGVGELWMIADDSLYAVDLLTGAATWIATSADGLEGVAAIGGELISVAGPFLDWDLVEVDKATGETTTIAELSGFNLSHFEALGFDRGSGDLWISGAAILPITPMVPYTHLFRVADLDSGVAEFEFAYDPLSGFFYPSLALPVAPPTVEIPTLSPAGVAALALVLAAAGLAAVRRRSPRAP